MFGVWELRSTLWMSPLSGPDTKLRCVVSTNKRASAAPIWTMCCFGTAMVCLPSRRLRMSLYESKIDCVRRRLVADYSQARLEQR